MDDSNAETIKVLISYNQELMKLFEKQQLIIEEHKELNKKLFNENEKNKNDNIKLTQRIKELHSLNRNLCLADDTLSEYSDTEDKFEYSL